MKKLRVILLIAGLLLGALFILPLLIGVWLPDVISAPEHTLAEQRLASGHSFRVVPALRLTGWTATTARVGGCPSSLMSSGKQQRLRWAAVASERWIGDESDAA
ncbi:MAG: hypothetical protein LW645_08290 [Verrucomicrobiaceae bacterium]|nr:hypothetical protein [Verrucomicrobiaceae bacterium]